VRGHAAELRVRPAGGHGREVRRHGGAAQLGIQLTRSSLKAAWFQRLETYAVKTQFQAFAFTFNW
jgi:hypothetical protein